MNFLELFRVNFLSVDEASRAAENALKTVIEGYCKLTTVSK